MKVLLRKQKGFKTRDLIKEAAEKDYHMVVMNHDEACKAVERAQKMGLSIRFPLVFDEFIMSGNFPASYKGFVIDDADYLLQQLAKGVPVGAISLTAMKGQEDIIESSGRTES